MCVCLCVWAGLVTSSGHRRPHLFARGCEDVYGLDNKIFFLLSVCVCVSNRRFRGFALLFAVPGGGGGVPNLIYSPDFSNSLKDPRILGININTIDGGGSSAAAAPGRQQLQGGSADGQQGDVHPGPHLITVETSWQEAKQ